MLNQHWPIKSKPKRLKMLIAQHRARKFIPPDILIKKKLAKKKVGTNDFAEGCNSRIRSAYPLP